MVRSSRSEVGEILHPILFTAGSFRFPTYGALLVLAILSAICTILRLGRREGLDTSQLLDFSTWILLVSLTGAKVLMVVSQWGYYRQFPGQIFSLDTLMSGGVFYGGFIAAVFFSAWYIRVHHLPFWKVFDVYAPAIALGQSVGRLGCFAAGCDYGKPTSSALGVVFRNPFSHEVSGVPLGISVYPTQLHESLATLAIFAFLLWRYSRKSRDGEIFVTYLALYAVARFFLEFLRGDEDRGFVFHHLLSTSQFVAILALAAAVWMALILRHKPARTTALGVKVGDGKGRGKSGEKNVRDAVEPSPRIKAATVAHAPKGNRD